MAATTPKSNLYLKNIKSNQIVTNHDTLVRDVIGLGCEKDQVNYFLSYILRDPKKYPEIAQKSVKN